LLVALPFRSAISNVFLTRKQYPDIMTETINEYGIISLVKKEHHFLA